MEILIILLVYIVFGIALYKVAKAKNREPLGWILVGIILPQL